MRIDEAGRDNHSGRIDGSSSFRRIDLSNSCDLVSNDADIGLKPRISATIYYVAACDERIKSLAHFLAAE